MLLARTHSPFGGFREDAVSTLGPFLGKDRVTSFINSLETEIRTQAEAGARQAIPDIRAEVENTAKAAVTPIVLGGVVVSAFAAIVGTIALFRTRRRKTGG